MSDHRYEDEDESRQGATMVMGRVALPNAPARMPDVGGTMVMGRVAMAEVPERSPELAGTMVGMVRAVPPAPRPSGPPRIYEILGHLGGGELGQAFRAQHRETGEIVALRIVRPDIVTVPGAVEALRDVAQMTKSLVHTHLARLIDLDETGSPTLVLEYVSGKKLSALMQERGTAPAAAVIDLGIRLCSGLAALHGAGLAHGRVHPGNVVLEAKTGRWVLLDMAQGYCVQGLEQANDLHALGALLYRMATGHDAFETTPITSPKVHVPGLSTGLTGVLMRSLAADSSLRFGSAVEMAQALVRAKSMP